MTRREVLETLAAASTSRPADDWRDVRFTVRGSREAGTWSGRVVEILEGGALRVALDDSRDAYTSHVFAPRELEHLEAGGRADR